MDPPEGGDQLSDHKASVRRRTSAGCGRATRSTQQQDLHLVALYHPVTVGEHGKACRRCHGRELVRTLPPR